VGEFCTFNLLHAVGALLPWRLSICQRPTSLRLPRCFLLSAVCWPMKWAAHSMRSWISG
jgi:hypothetical protein